MKQITGAAISEAIRKVKPGERIMGLDAAAVLRLALLATESQAERFRQEHGWTVCNLCGFTYVPGDEHRRHELSEQFRRHHRCSRVLALESEPAFENSGPAGWVVFEKPGTGVVVHGFHTRETDAIEACVDPSWWVAPIRAGQRLVAGEEWPRAFCPGAK